MTSFHECTGGGFKGDNTCLFRPEFALLAFAFKDRVLSLLYLFAGLSKRNAGVSPKPHITTLATYLDP